MAESSSESSRGGASRKTSSSGGGSSRRSSSKSTARRSSSSSSRSSRSSANSRSTSKSRSSSSGSRSAASRRAAAVRGGRARFPQQTAEKRAREAGEFSGKSAAEVRDAITRGVIRPLNLIMLTRDRIEEVVGDAVDRGRVTAEDAQTIVQGLLKRGREQTDSVLGDLENLLGRGRGSGSGAGAAVGRVTSAARKRALEAADPVIAQADRARRVAGVGPAFPILGYDDLTAAQVQSRLDGLSPAELRKVRDYERRHANRKSVLDAVAAKLP
jgi:hypothetical protein